MLIGIVYIFDIYILSGFEIFLFILNVVVGFVGVIIILYFWKVLLNVCLINVFICNFFL